MEIRQEYLVKQIPGNCESFPCHIIEQTYLCTGLVVRIRREDSSYYLTHKGKGPLSREEYNLSLSEQAYHYLLARADGIILAKKHYFIPVENAGHLTIGVDVLEGSYQGLVLAEVEFPAEEEAMVFKVPEQFGRDAIFSGGFQNNRLAYGDTNIPCRQA